MRLIFSEMEKRCRVETVLQWECVFVLMLMFLCVSTSVSVEHGHIQVCSTSVDEVLFQSLTSQEIFSNGGKMRGNHTQTHTKRAHKHTHRLIHIKNKGHQSHETIIEPWSHPRPLWEYISVAPHTLQYIVTSNLLHLYSTDPQIAKCFFF